MFKLMTPSVSGSPVNVGKSSRVTGRSSRAMIRVMPARCATSIRPLQRQIDPASVSTRVTARPPSSKAALFTASIRPLHAPKITASSAITPRIPFI